MLLVVVSLFVMIVFVIMMMMMMVFMVCMIAVALCHWYRNGVVLSNDDEHRRDFFVVCLVHNSIPRRDEHDRVGEVRRLGGSGNNAVAVAGVPDIILNEVSVIVVSI